MGKLKIYKEMKARNEEEKRTGKASYRTLIEKLLHNEIFMCNNIQEVDTSIWDNVSIGSLYYYIDNEGNYRTEEDYQNDTTGEIYEKNEEIYQYFLCNLSQYQIDYINKLEKDNNDNSLIVTYSDLLDCEVLCVTHWGTSWDYVPTNVELTENLKESLED